MPRCGGSDGHRNFEALEHALEVARQTAWSHWMRVAHGDNAAVLRDTARVLNVNCGEGVNDWIRPTASPGNMAFRVSPPRKWGWEHLTFDGLGLALSEADPGVLSFDGFEQP